MSDVTALLAFIHARKWLVELILFAALAAGIAWFCHHLIGVGVQRQKDDDARELEAQRKELTAKAETASHAHDKELLELTSYVNSHPLHGSLCQRPRVPAAGSAVSFNAGAGAATWDLLPVPSGDHRSDAGEPDQLHMLDLLGRRADEVSAGLREWQGR
ncbi:MAG TPA: hypothetical protein VN612_10570 [Acidobacteriaceae bacterium]|nr:hypothetical protein [Acidobacteriaceae bacterium]